MTLDDFCQLPPASQLYRVLSQGTFLARRWEEEGDISLYHCPGEHRGFLVELRYHERADAMQVVSIFADTKPLDSYAPYLRLPEL